MNDLNITYCAKDDSIDDKLFPQDSCTLITSIPGISEFNFKRVEIKECGVLEDFLNAPLTTKEIEEEMFRTNSGYYILKNYPLWSIIKYRIKRFFNKLFK